MLPGQPIAETSADAMFAVDITRGVLLYEFNAEQPVAPASTLKMVTALTALTVLDPDDVIRINQNDLVDTTVYSNAQLQANDELSTEDLLAGLLIPSGGDAANALARVAGSRLGPQVGQSPRARFIEEMNAVAGAIGMTGSNFVNPDGPDDPNQYTTARDLAIAGAELLENRLLADIVASPAWSITISGPNARQYEVLNTNAFIGIDRVHGIKTGTTGQAGESVVLATRRGGNQIITVVMGSDARYQDTNNLLAHLDNQIRWVQFGASTDFPGVLSAAERYNFVLVVPFVEPRLRQDAERLSSRLVLGPRPRGTQPVRWGHVVFLNDGEELYLVPVLRTGDSDD